MIVTNEQVAEWLDNEFEGLSKEQLAGACRTAGLSFGGNTSPAGLRNKLLTKFGLLGNKPTTKEVAPKNFRRPPQLTSIIAWKGKRRRIKAFAKDQKDGGDRKFPVGWEGEVFFIDPKEPFQDVPWPVYQNLKDAVKRDVSMKWLQGTNEMQYTWTESMCHAFQDMGDTPGTSDLAISLVDWYRRDALATDLYADDDQEVIGRIWGHLTDGQRPNKEDRDHSPDVWRREVLQLLGLTPEQIEADAERLAA